MSIKADKNDMNKVILVISGIAFNIFIWDWVVELFSGSYG